VSEILLINVSGQDKAGLTASLASIAFMVTRLIAMA